MLNILGFFQQEDTDSRIHKGSKFQFWHPVISDRFWTDTIKPSIYLKKKSTKHYLINAWHSSDIYIKISFTNKILNKKINLNIFFAFSFVYDKSSLNFLPLLKSEEM